MAEVSFNVHRFRDQVLLELIVDAGNGNVSAESVELDILDDDGRLTPCGELPPDYEEEIRTRLEDAGYAVVSQAA